MFFKKGLKDSSLIQKLTMKNPRMSEEMLDITNKYALVGEATLNTREQKKEELVHTTIRRGKRIVPSTWWNGRKTRSIYPGRVNLKAFWITSSFSTPRECIRPGTATDSKVLQMRCSRRPKGSIKRKSSKNPRVTSLKLIRRSTISMVILTHMSQGGSINSQFRKS
jgi:hypothetical protein